MATLDFTPQFAVIDPGCCNAQFAVPKEVYDRWVARKTGWHCPHCGSGRKFTGESLEAQVKRLEQERNPHAIRQYIAMGDRISALEAQLAASEAARCRHGWKGSKPESTARIETPCPACGLKSLFIAAGNHLTCANLSCKEPSPESWCAAALARAEEAERVAVFAAVSTVRDPSFGGLFILQDSGRQKHVPHDGTPAGIYSALRQAMGVRGGRKKPSRSLHGSSKTQDPWH